MKELAKTAVYGMVEVVTLGRGVARSVNGERVRFTPRWSRFYPRTYEIVKHHFLAQHCRPGAVAVDVGAHVGLFTVVMARRVGASGTVVSFEPAAETHRILAQTVHLNRLDDVVQLRSEAVAARGGTQTLFVSEAPADNANSLIQLRPGSTATEVETVSLDEALASWQAPVCCLKIDAEGAEFDVLRGARGTIARWRPGIALEVHPGALPAAGTSSHELWELIASFDLAVRDDGAPVARAHFLTRTEPFEVQLVPTR